MKCSVALSACWVHFLPMRKCLAHPYNVPSPVADTSGAGMMSGDNPSFLEETASRQLERFPGENKQTNKPKPTNKQNTKQKPIPPPQKTNKNNNKNNQSNKQNKTRQTPEPLFLTFWTSVVAKRQLNKECRAAPCSAALSGVQENTEKVKAKWKPHSWLWGRKEGRKDLKITPYI